MSETTVTIRSVDSKVWKEFQTGIVTLHGNLYGNIGQELTNALKIWLKNHQKRDIIVGIPADRLSVSYNDIGGLKEEIKMTREMVEIPIKHPELFRWLNLIPPKGILIHGPPGTGKNILVKAATAEAKAQLYILSIMQILGELSEMTLREVFRKAKENAPSVILIPDLNLLTVNTQKVSEDPTNQIISWLVSEIDTLEDFCNVIVIGITSAPNELEPSFRQRFQKEIEVSFPDRQGRYEILRIQTKNMPLAEDVDLEKLADITDQYQGMLLQRICQESATLALRRILEHGELTNEKIPQEKLEQIRVGMDDFIHAFESLKSKEINIRP
ncbi:MAG: AAA family ATPase [Candidatus Hodarchaeota archaeon]